MGLLESLFLCSQLGQELYGQGAPVKAEWATIINFMLIALAKSRSTTGASHQPGFMIGCLTISHTCLPRRPNERTLPLLLLVAIFSCFLTHSFNFLKENYRHFGNLHLHMQEINSWNRNKGELYNKRTQSKKDSTHAQLEKHFCMKTTLITLMAITFAKSKLPVSHQ